MKKIVEYRKLLGVDKTVELKELKTVYRNFMKEWHPDKFHENDELKQQAEEKSKEIIEAYNFLLSIAPETIEQALPEYNATTASSAIVDYQYKSQILHIDFADGSKYEYFDVPKAIYIKMVNSDAIGRFARRHIYHSFTYRKISSAVMV